MNYELGKRAEQYLLRESVSKQLVHDMLMRLDELVDLVEDYMEENQARKKLGREMLLAIEDEGKRCAFHEDLRKIQEAVNDEG